MADGADPEGNRGGSRARPSDLHVTKPNRRWPLAGYREPTFDDDAALIGTIEYGRTSEYLEDEQLLPHVARTETFTASIDVSLDSDNTNDDALVDSGSTYEVDRSTHDERQNGECMAIFDTRSLGTYAFTDRPNGPEFENYIGG